MHTSTRAILVFLLLVLLVPGRFASANDLDALQAGNWLARAAGEFITAFAAQDEEGLRTYVTTHRDKTSLERTPVDARVARQLQFGSMLGAVEIVAISEMSPSRVAVVVHSPVTEGHFEMFFEASDDEDGKIGTQGVSPTQAPGVTVSLDGLATLQDVADALLGEGGAPGLALAIADAEGGVEVAVAGTRRVDVDSPIQQDDAFHLGSLTKSMTASIALRLSGEGRLDLDDRLTTLLDDVWMHSGYAEVTFADLLTHRAGVEPLTEGDLPREARWRDAGDDPREQRRALVRDVLSRAPAAAPGAAMQYSNGGYVIAAVVMEQLTGTAWEDLVVEHVFEPLALASAHTGWPWSHAEDTTRGHYTVNGNLVAQADSGYALDGPVAPAGDVSTNVADLARYGAAHLRALAGDDSWLDPALAARMHTPAGGGATGYGFGWSIDVIDDHEVHRHSGSAGTYYAVIAICPEEGLSIAAVFNAGAMGLQSAADRVMGWAFAR